MDFGDDGGEFFEEGVNFLAGGVEAEGEADGAVGDFGVVVGGHEDVGRFEVARGAGGAGGDFDAF